MNSKMILVLGCTLALAAAVAAPSVAQVSEADAARAIENLPTSVAVKYGDLDLNSQQGSATMLQRIRDAALEACGASSFSVQDYRWATQRSACYRRGVDHAVAQLGSPSVMRLYEQHGVYASN